MGDERARAVSEERRIEQRAISGLRAEIRRAEEKENQLDQRIEELRNKLERKIEQRAVSGLRGLQRSTDRDTQETRQQIADESKRAQDTEAQERARAVNEERRIEQRAVSGLRGLQRSTDRDTEETRQQIADESKRAQ